MLLEGINYYYAGLYGTNNTLFSTNKVSFMSQLRQADYGPLRPFAYGVQDDSLIENPKEFDLKLTVMNIQYTKGSNATVKSDIGNVTIDRLMHAARNNKNRGNYGKDILPALSITVDSVEYFLDCYCTGVTNITYDRQDVFQFNAHFYAPNGFRWYTITTHTGTADSNGDFSISVGKYDKGDRKFLVRAETPAKSNTDKYYRIYFNSNVDAHGDVKFNLFYIPATYTRFTYDSKRRIAYLDKGAYDSTTNAQEDALQAWSGGGYFDFGSTVAEQHPSVTTDLLGTGFYPNTSVTVLEYRYLEMPKWKAPT